MGLINNRLSQFKLSSSLQVGSDNFANSLNRRTALNISLGGTLLAIVLSSATLHPLAANPSQSTTLPSNPTAEASVQNSSNTSAEATPAAPDQTTTTTPPKQNNSNLQVNINGQSTSVAPNESFHKTITSPNGQSTVDVVNNSSSSAGGDGSTSNVQIYTNSSSSSSSSFYNNRQRSGQ